MKYKDWYAPKKEPKHIPWDRITYYLIITALIVAIITGLLAMAWDATLALELPKEPQPVRIALLGDAAIYELDGEVYWRVVD